jgi:hypothetical protein
LWGNDTTCPDLVGIVPPLSLFLRPYLVTSLLHFFYTLSHGSPPGTRPHPPRSRRSLGLYRRSALLRGKTPMASRPPPRRHHLPRRTHHLLLPDRHLPHSQPRSFSPLLAFWAVPQVTRSFRLLSFNSSISFTSFSQRRTPRG